MEMASVLPILEEDGKSAGDEQHIGMEPFGKAMRVTTAVVAGLAVVSLGLAVAAGFAWPRVPAAFHGSDGLMKAWEDFNEDSVTKIFQIQSLKEQDYLYADEEVTAGSSGTGNDFKVHIHNSPGQIMLQGFRGKYVYWEAKDGVWSLSLKTLDKGNFNGFIFYRRSGSPTFELTMGGSAVKLCRKETGNGLVVATPAKPCWSTVAEKWTFKDVTSYYDTDGVNNFGNGKNNRMQPWEDFSENSVNKIFKIQSVSHEDYMYADGVLGTGSSGSGNDFKVHSVHNSKGQIRLQDFRGKYVYWEAKNGVWTLSLKSLGDGTFNGFVFYLKSGGPTFELLMGGSAVKLCRKQTGNGVVVGTPAEPCFNKGAGKWTFKDVTAFYDEHGVASFGNGKNNRSPCTVTTWTGRRCDGKKVETYSSSSVQEFKWSGGHQENDPNSARVTGANCDKVEFYDEDKNRAGYEDNEWKHGEGCLEFPWDLRGDLGGLQICSK